MRRILMRTILLLVLIMILSISSYAVEANNLIHIRGIVTNEGVECPAIRGDDGKLYTLTGFSEQLYVGDVIEVVGRPAEVSICMQGITLSVVTYKKLAASGYSYVILNGEILPETVGVRNCFALRLENGDIYGIDKGEKMIKILPGFYTIIAEERLTKDLPCGKDVVKAYNLVNILSIY